MRNMYFYTSSKKMTQGRLFLALRKTALTALSLSPTYMLMSSGPFTLMKLIPASLAMALATSVLPHPGGPTNSTPGDYKQSHSVLDQIKHLAEG